MNKIIEEGTPLRSLAAAGKEMRCTQCVCHEKPWLLLFGMSALCVVAWVWRRFNCRLNHWMEFTHHRMRNVMASCQVKAKTLGGEGQEVAKTTTFPKRY